MRRMRPLACCLGILGALLASGSAQAIGILAAQRSVTISYGLYDPFYGVVYHSQNASDPTGSGGWIGNVSYDQLANAYQDSLISEGQLSGTGTVWRLGQYDSASSRYTVTFDASEATLYGLTVDNGIHFTLGYNWFANASITLNRVDPNDSTVILQTIHSLSLPPGGSDISLEGILAPGTYVLDYWLRVTSSHNAAEPATVAFSFLPIPEPGTALLVATGLLGLAYRQRWHGCAA